MKQAAVKLMLICFFTGFGVFFGLDVAKHGIEQVNGPLTAAVADEEVSPAPVPSPSPSATPEPVAEQPKPASRQTKDGDPSLVERGTEGVSRSLQWLAKQCMHAVGKLYDAVLG